MRLELGGILLSLLLGIFLLLFFFFNRFAFFVEFLLFGRRGLRCNKEHLQSRLVANWIAIENVTSVLTVILTESPAESFTHHFGWDLLFGWVLFEVLIDSKLKLKWLKFVVRVCLIFSKLFHLLSVCDSKIIFLTFTFTFSRSFTLLSITFSWCLFSSSFARSYFFSVNVVRLFLVFGIFTAIGLLSKSLFFFDASCFSNFSFFLEAFLLGSSFLGQASKTDFLVLSKFVLSFLFFIPVLDVMQDLFFVDVGNSIVLGKLLSIETLSTARFARYGYLEGLETTFFTELFFDLLDVFGETALTVPLETTFISSGFCFSVFIIACSGSFLHEDSRRLSLDIEHDEFFPIEMQVERSLLGMDISVLKRDVIWLYQASTDTVRDSLDKFLLSGLLSIIDTEDVLLFRGCLEDFLHHTCKIFHVDSWHVVLTLANDWQFLWVLFPCTLKMVIENGLTKSIKHTS